MRWAYFLEKTPTLSSSPMGVFSETTVQNLITEVGISRCTGRVRVIGSDNGAFWEGLPQRENFTILSFPFMQSPQLILKGTSMSLASPTGGSMPQWSSAVMDSSRSLSLLNPFWPHILRTIPQISPKTSPKIKWMVKYTHSGPTHTLSHYCLYFSLRIFYVTSQWS